MFRKILSIVLSVCFLALSFCYNVSAVGETVVGGHIIIDTVEGYTGETVLVNINMENNPGIMAITLSIGYDSSSLEYINYHYGDIFSDYILKALPKENKIRLVICEKGNVNKDGTILSLSFKISEKAAKGIHPITIDYSAGDFANYDMDYVMPTVENGGVEVLNCGHPDTYWVMNLEPTFEANGSKNCVCKGCGTVMEQVAVMKLVYGDLSRDGNLKSNDLVGLRRFLLGTLNIENYEEIVADINGDDAVDIKDIVRFKKYFVGDEISLGKPQ